MITGRTDSAGYSGRQSGRSSDLRYGELPMKELVTRLQAGESFNSLKDIRQTVYLTGKEEIKPDDIVLFSHEECLRDKLKQAKNFRQSKKNRTNISIAYSPAGWKADYCSESSFPSYDGNRSRCFVRSASPACRIPNIKGKVIPAFEMIKFSVNMHRGCFWWLCILYNLRPPGKFIASRSKESILKRSKRLSRKCQISKDT